MSTSNEPSALTPTQWLICVIASIGFAFDIYELLMLPLILRPALMELTGAVPGTPDFAMWAGRLFYIPAFAGGIFGLLGGYLTDLLGRRRVLTGSILLYAFSAFFAGYSTSIEMLLVLRCTTFIGVCIEFVAAVAWLAELFSDPHQRERVLGYTQAFSSIGGLLVAGANGLAITYASSLPGVAPLDFLSEWLGPVKDPHAPWRYTLMSGLIPAIPLILIRPFLPESPAWAEKKRAGTLRRPSIVELFQPELRRTTIVTAIMFACSYGAAFGAIQQIPQIVPGLAEVKQRVAEATAGGSGPGSSAAKGSAAKENAAKESGGKEDTTGAKTAEAADGKAATARGPAGGGTPGKGPAAARGKLVEQAVASDVTKVQEIGGLVGRFALAVLAVRILSRRRLLRVFQIPGLLLMPLVFFFTARYIDAATSDPGGGQGGLTFLYGGIFVCGVLTVAQFSFWGNYLPRVYPLHLRGTGESFAANIGGRMIGTSFAWVASTLSATAFMPGGSPPAKMAYTAAGIALFVYLAGSIACFFLPEPGQGELHE